MTTKTLWRWMLTLVAAIALSASFSACGDDDDEGGENGEGSVTGTASKLIGLWVDEDGDYTKFNADGSGFMYASGRGGRDGDYFSDFKVDREDGEYILMIKWDDENAWEDEGVIEFEGSSTFYLDYGSGALAFYRQ